MRTFWARPSTATCGPTVAVVHADRPCELAAWLGGSVGARNSPSHQASSAVCEEDAVRWLARSPPTAPRQRHLSTVIANRIPEARDGW